MLGVDLVSYLACSDPSDDVKFQVMVINPTYRCAEFLQVLKQKISRNLKKFLVDVVYTFISNTENIYSVFEAGLYDHVNCFGYIFKNKWLKKLKTYHQDLTLVKTARAKLSLMKDYIQFITNILSKDNDMLIF